MMLAFTALILIVHSYVAWAAGRMVAGQPWVVRFAAGGLVALVPFALLAVYAAASFDGRCNQAAPASETPCTLGEHVRLMIELALPYLALPTLIWLGFYSSSLARAKAEGR